MNRNRLLITDDGSHTMYSEKAGENYHSSFGAIQESEHIFIRAGLDTIVDKDLKLINILEVGTGTGLNIILAYLWVEKNNINIDYQGYEPFPISKDVILLLNYPQQLSVDEKLFFHIHNSVGKSTKLSDKFSLVINEALIQESKLESEYYDIVFFDAFSPEAQHEMWTTNIFTEMYKSLKHGGVLTTYSCKGTVKRALKEAGFAIEKLPGPPGKREFLRAWKE